MSFDPMVIWVCLRKFAMGVLSLESVRRRTRIMYGVNARMFCLVVVFFIFLVRNVSSFFGTKNLCFSARLTTIKPTNPATKEGSSGPMKIAVKIYGIVNASPENIARGIASLMLPFFWNLCTNIMRINGMNKPATA